MIFIHELSSVRIRTDVRSERKSFLMRINKRVTTKFSQFDGFTIFLKYGGSACALLALQLSYYVTSRFIVSPPFIIAC